MIAGIPLLFGIGVMGFLYNPEKEKGVKYGFIVITGKIAQFDQQDAPN